MWSQELEPAVSGTGRRYAHRSEDIIPVDQPEAGNRLVDHVDSIVAASGSGPWHGCRGVSSRIGSQKGHFADKYASGGLILPFLALWG